MSASATDSNRPLKELLPLFYSKYNLDFDGGHHESTVKIELTSKFYFYIPNSNDRRRALLKHDLHHLITGYRSDMRGETEIGSWEIASGCNTYWAAWVLDFFAMSWGILFNTGGVFRAFVRGLRSENLYANDITNECALEMTVPQLQQLLDIPPLEQPLQYGVKDALLFLFWLGVSGLIALVSIALLPLVVVYNLFVFAKKGISS